MEQNSALKPGQKLAQKHREKLEAAKRRCETGMLEKFVFYCFLASTQCSSIPLIEEQFVSNFSLKSDHFKSGVKKEFYFVPKGFTLKH